MDSMLNSFNAVKEASIKEDDSLNEDKSSAGVTINESLEPEAEKLEYTEDNSAFIDESAVYDPSMEDAISPSDFGGFDF